MRESLDFKQIRLHKGSQNNAFEELICQLAGLSPPSNGKSFIRKDGSGGDAGVECFWKLKDGSEHAWQAKYFLNTITDKQWNQISDSVKTALEKHPKLKKYYICLPLDRTDRRQDNRESQLDKWNKKITEWKKIAKQKKMNVTFEFWGEYEIHQKLNTDDPRFFGKALYWFNSLILQIEHLEDIAEKSKKSLGDRFSPEFNVELPIAKSFDGVGLTPNWYKRFDSVKEEWLKALEKLKVVIAEQDRLLTEKRWNPIKEHTLKLESLLKQTIKTNSLYENGEALKTNVHDLTKNIKIEMNYIETETVKKINRCFNHFSNATYKLSDFLFSKDMTAFFIKSMLLSGEAGSGKSHLLCDITLNRLNNKLPTLFLLGQHYSGGNPLKFISDSLDLKNNSDKEILGALDALGEAHSTRTLIIIDAINEGPYKEEWENHIEQLIIELCKYPYIALVFSCRSTYLQHLLPQIKNSGKNHNETKLTVEIEHKGFSDLDDIYKYLEKHDIFVPNIPIMEPEFSNPLFLKIYCKSLKAKGESKFSQGSKSIETIFNLYVDSISETINKNKKYRTGEKIVSKALQSFALQLFPDNLDGLQTNKARKIIQAEDPTPNTGSLFNELLNEGILSEDIIPHKASDLLLNKKEKNPADEHEYRKEPIVRFTYERFSDYFIVKSLIEKEIYEKPKKIKKTINKIKCFFYRIISKEYCLDDENLKIYFREGSALGNIFRTLNDGIIEALFTRIADDFKVELYNLVEIENKQYLLEEHLKKSFLWRSSNSFTSRTLELLSQLLSIHFHSPILQILLKLSVKPEHPWNADFLHKILIDSDLAERDKFWSTHIFFSYHYSKDLKITKDLTIKKLIDWPYSSYFKNMDSKHVRLYVIVLTWLTTSSHRELRDKATKSAIIILSRYPEHLLKLMDQFSEVNDLYVRERLYAIAYGVAVNIKDKNLIKKIAEKTYEQVFKTGKPEPHILLRDYARCVLELAYKKKLLSDEIDPKSFRPPYKSDWPIENPMDSEIDSLEVDKKYSSVRHSLMSFFSDFGNYTMSCVHSFSPTLLTKEHPETKKELQRKFIDKLSDKQKALYYGYLKKSKIIKKQQEEKNKFIETLNEEQREEKRWLFDDGFMGMGDGVASFSRKQAQRWVCKQVYEMGWRKDLFEKFDKDDAVFSLRDRGKKSLERIGKKYQWIAFHKLLAHLADNVHYIDQFDDKNKYEGPWQLSQRDIDPTCYLRKTGDKRQLEIIPNCWWQPDAFEFPKKSIEKQEEWFKLKNIAVPFKEFFQVKDPKDNSFWTVLHSYLFQKKELSPDKKEEKLYKPGCWFRISAVIISKKDCNVLCEKLKNKDLRNPNIAERGSISTRFLKEYLTYNEHDNDWEEELSGNNVSLSINHLRPIIEYNWESGNTDYSMDETISFYLPSKTLIDKLNLKYPHGQFENWVNNDNIPVFKDPSIKLKGPSCPLIKTDVLNSWLNKDNLCLVWLIGGEKQLYGKNSMSGKRHDFSGVYFTNGNQIEGAMWFLDISSWEI